MNGWKAAELDKKGWFYAEYDEEHAMHGVFGSESGHCYASFSGEDEAKKHADEMNDAKA